MKKHTKSLLLALCMVALLGNVKVATADTTPEIEAIFNWAENNFPELFPNPQATQMVTPWAFRFYPSTNIHVGVNNGNVFTLGGPWGNDNPTLIDTVTNLSIQIASTGGGGVPGCSDELDLPTGLVFTQSGEVINVTSNGQCIKLPENTGFCGVSEPSVPEQTGVSVLSRTTVTSFVLTGLEISVPGVSSPADSLAENTISCTINAPSGFPENRIINTDVCYDLTDTFIDFPSIPGVISITPPVTSAIVSTTNFQAVTDCFATDASVVTDFFTRETSIRGADGTFTTIGF